MKAEVRKFLAATILMSMVASAWAADAAGKKTPKSKVSARKRFAMEVLRTAVALPQPDPQDRLRVLNSAAGVAAPLSPKLARSLAREGAQLELELITAGQAPAVSLLASGHADCTTAAHFVEAIPTRAVQQAEDSLLGALSLCPKQTFEPARQKLEAALNDGTLAARALLALMETAGPRSAWSQERFVKMFSTLPREAERFAGEAPHFAAMFVRMAPEVERDAAREAGMKFLEWLSRLEAGNERNFAVNLATDALQQALGPGAYEEALRGNVVAAGVARTAGEPAEIEHAEYESVSVLQAMGQRGTDRTEEISKMPASLRAREAAAHGFATGTEGDRKLAERYFEIAFAALDELWKERRNDAPAVIEEVSEAAAHVDAVAALVRAQQLDDPTAQAISMLAVARVVVGAQEP
jgi:hypothetical protein